jgi:hypothetical protein
LTLKVIVTNTPLFLAVQNGNIDIVKMLLEAGHNPNEVNAEGLSPLGLAVTTDNLEIVQLLTAHIAATEPESQNLLEQEKKQYFAVENPSLSNEDIAASGNVSNSGCGSVSGSIFAPIILCLVYGRQLSNLIQTHGVVLGVVWWVIEVVQSLLLFMLLLVLAIAALVAVWCAGSIALWYAMRYAGIERHVAWDRSANIVTIGLIVIAILVIFGWIIYQIFSHL